MTTDFDEIMKLLARYERPDGSIGPRFVRHGRQRRWSFDDAIALLDRKLGNLQPGWGGRKRKRKEGKAPLPNPSPPERGRGLGSAFSFFDDAVGELPVDLAVDVDRALRRRASGPARC